MPQLDRALVKERAARLRATGENLAQAHLSRMVGSEETVLVEMNGMAHTENFTLAAAPGLRPRSLLRVRVTGHNGRHLIIDPIAA